MSAAEFVEEVLALYDEELRGRVPEMAPFGVVVARDGSVVRWHFGTHGLIDHGALPDDGLAELISRLQAEFAFRGEPVEWRVYDHDQRPDVENALRAAGFVAGSRRPLLAMAVDLLAPRPRVNLPEGVTIRVAVGSEMRKSLAELAADVVADNRGEAQVLVVQRHERVVGAGWASHPRGSRIVVVGGMTGAYPEMVSRWIDTIGRAYWDRDFDARYVVAECGGVAGDALIAAGFRPIGGVTPYHWSPPGPLTAARPVRMLLNDPEGDELWERFVARFDVRLSRTDWQVFTAPPNSLTVHFGTHDPADSSAGTPVDRAVERALRALTEPGEEVFKMSCHSVGRRFFPHRVGGPGQPPWPLSVEPVCCYAVCVTADLRMGVFSDALGMSVTVFGTELAHAVEANLAEIEGSGIGADRAWASGVWSFGQDPSG